MAQIVTITNPLTGQPTQVDQLEHTAQQIDDAIARAIPGGAIDIALANNDPRNWGLGAYAKDTSDLDSITDTGWYVGKPLVDGDITLGNSAINHIRIGESNNAVQIAYTNSASSWDGCIVLIREKKSGIWCPWSWFNPPMRLDTEYRTTERFNGKPVYVKSFNFNSWTADTVTSLNVAATCIVDDIMTWHMGTMKNGVDHPSGIKYWVVQNGEIFDSSIGNNMAVKMFGTDNWGGNKILTVKYTKD